MLFHVTQSSRDTTWYFQFSNFVVTVHQEYCNVWAPHACLVIAKGAGLCLENSWFKIKDFNGALYNRALIILTAINCYFPKSIRCAERHQEVTHTKSTDFRLTQAKTWYQYQSISLSSVQIPETECRWRCGADINIHQEFCPSGLWCKVTFQKSGIIHYTSKINALWKIKKTLPTIKALVMYTSSVAFWCKQFFEWPGDSIRRKSTADYDERSSVAQPLSTSYILCH